MDNDSTFTAADLQHMAGDLTAWVSSLSDEQLAKWNVRPAAVRTADSTPTGRRTADAEVCAAVTSLYVTAVLLGESDTDYTDRLLEVAQQFVIR